MDHEIIEIFTVVLDWMIETTCGRRTGGKGLCGQEKRRGTGKTSIDSWDDRGPRSHSR